jgi:hypothetical protein
MSCPWVDILTPADIAAQFALTARIDPGFAAAQRRFYETRTTSQLDALARQSWLCNEPDGYQLARSFAALIPQGD